MVESQITTAGIANEGPFTTYSKVKRRGRYWLPMFTLEFSKHSATIGYWPTQELHMTALAFNYERNIPVCRFNYVNLGSIDEKFRWLYNVM